MQRAVECVEYVNSLTDAKGISLTRKVMIRCGLSKDVDGVWKIQRLSRELQNIVHKHPAQFNGMAPETEEGLDTTVSESYLSTG